MVGRARPCSGQIVSGDFNYRAVSVLDFTGGRIVQIRFPAADAATADVGTVRVTLSVASMVQKAGGGGSLVSTAGTHSKGWLSSNFRFVMGQLPTDGVDRIDPVTVSPPSAPSAFETRLPAGDTGPFADAARTQTVLPAALTFLHADQSTPLLRLAFPSAGVGRVTMDGSSVSGDPLQKARVLLSPGPAFLAWGG